jgi:RNA ligase
MAAGDDMEAVRRELPEEFWGDFDGIYGALQSRTERLVLAAKDRCDTYADWSDKELGLTLHRINADVRPLVFPMRKHGEAKVRAMALKAVRPTGNVLAGYEPSSVMHRVTEAG